MNELVLGSCRMMRAFRTIGIIGKVVGPLGTTMGMDVLR